MTEIKPKIAQVVCTYPPYRGGMGNVAFEYTERLRERGYDVHVFTTKGHVEVDDPDYVHRVPSIVHIGNAGVMPSLFRRLSGFDLVHLHYPFFGGAEPTIVRKAISPNQGLVMTYHMDATGNGVRGTLFNAHKRILLPWLVNRTDRILASSKDYINGSAISEIQGAMDRVEIHPFGIDLHRFRPGNAEFFKRRLDIRTDVPVILFVGGLDSAHYFKGAPILLEALKLITPQPWEMLIVGDGNLRSSFETVVRKSILNGRVHFLGNVAERDIPFIYQLSDFHVFPSLKRAEAFGLVALEAAASGIPTIASNLPGVRTVVLDGSTGLLVPPEDITELANAITLFLSQPEVRKRFGQAARLNAESNFDWEPAISNLEKTYRSVLEQKSTREYI
ncbi:glycosyltransferase family 4 protein [Candidatus Uhrbacteria bacterium]|nr:glycosyltransferase family 4 protein [Candidatus Uhrbacteria bacterium]